MSEALAGPRQVVHIVVTCANRKRLPIPQQLRLGNLGQRDADERLSAWVQRLSTGQPGLPATQMYAGEHWQAALQLPVVTEPHAKLWVCSAGYGLIPADAVILPYAATFASRQVDSVGNSTEDAQRWWTQLAEWEGPRADEARSFSELAQRNTDDLIIAVLSEAYLRACSDDLLAAAAHMRSDGQLSVIGPPERSSDIDDLIVPVTARLRPTVGGSLQALNVRVAAYLLKAAAGEPETPLSRSLLCKLAVRATDAAPGDPSRRTGGKRMTDEEVRDYIRTALPHGPATATRLLRVLRASGHSCEQSRFKLLFAEVASTEAIW